MLVAVGLLRLNIAGIFQGIYNLAKLKVQISIAANSEPFLCFYSNGLIQFCSSLTDTKPLFSATALYKIVKKVVKPDSSRGQRA